MTPTVLDSDTLSEILRGRNANVTTHAVNYLGVHARFTFSAMTRFEIRRGYSLINSTKALTRFEQMCSNSIVIPVTDMIFDRACDLWVIARRGGHPAGDADLMIAATAMEYGYSLATGNIRHYDWIKGLIVENWRLP